MFNEHAMVRTKGTLHSYMLIITKSRNTQIIDTCVVFRSWHIHSVSSFVFSCLVIVALGVFYEYLRAYQKAFDHRIATSLATKNRAITGSRGGSRSGSERSSPEGRLEDAGLLNGRRSLKHKGVG